MHKKFSLLFWVIFFVCVIFGCGSNGLKINSSENKAILEAISDVSSNEIYKTVKDLEDFKTRYTWEKQTEVADYLFGRFRRYGIQVSFDEYHWKEKKWKNVIATIEGKSRPEDVYMVIAHFDSISKKPERHAPGADDNASGTAAVLEIARILKTLSLPATFKIGMFSNEEQKRAGSKHFVKMADEEGVNIRGVINLDVIGYNDPLGNLIIKASEKRSLKNVVKLKLKRIRNYFLKAIHPDGRVVIAGRLINRGLVERASALAKKYSKLGVKDRVGDDCG
ncbi:M28 family metallopeptidase [Thermodesulfobacteriota bacterium]